MPAILLLPVFALLCFTPSLSFAYDEEFNEGPLYDEYFFSIVYPPEWTIAPIITAYENEGRYYLPILELAEGFEFFAEDQEIDRLYVSGFAADENNTFVFDGINKRLIVKGETIPIEDNAFLSPEETNTEDIYVQMEVLNQLWPVNMQVDLSTLTITTTSETVLSFERRKDRKEQRIIQTSRREQREREEEKLKGFIEVENTPSLISKPIIDIQSQYKFSQDENNITGQTNISASHQLAGMVADYAGNINLTENGKFREPRNIRFKLWRESSDDEYVFVKGVKNLEIGDVSVQQRDLVGNNMAGRGVIISNEGQKSNQEFDTVTIEGRGPIGWEVEVYNNSELVANGVVDSDGEYRFEDIDLFFGNNVIRTVLYGPQGQIREETENYTIGGRMLPPGEFKYYIGLTDRDRYLIPLNDDRTNIDEGVGQSYLMRVGLHERASVFASYNRHPSNRNDSNQYASAGVTFSTPIGMGEVEAYKQISRGHAINTSFITRLLGVRLNLQNAFFNDFESEDASYGFDAKKVETEIDAKTNVRLPFANLGLNLNYQRTERVSENVLEQYRIGQSLSKAGFRFNHSTLHRFLNNDDSGASGRLDANYRSGDWQYRANMNYTISPEMELNTAGAEIRYKPNRFQAAFNTQYNFLSDISSQNVQLGYQFDKVLASMDVGHQDYRGWEVLLRATTSLYPYNKEEEYQLSSNTQRRATPIKALVYQDYNFNSQFDPEVDTPLSDVFLDRNGARSRDRTDENGEVLVYGSKNRQTALSVNKRSLGNPYFAPAVPGYITTPRIATMPRLEFPVIETGSIDGEAYDASTDQIVSGLRLDLVDENGNVVASTKTGYDGFYIFEFVKPGEYTIRIDESYQNTRAKPVPVSITPEDLFVFNVDVIINEENQPNLMEMSDKNTQTINGIEFVEW